MSCLNHDWTQFRCPNCSAEPREPSKRDRGVKALQLIGCCYGLQGSAEPDGLTLTSATYGLCAMDAPNAMPAGSHVAHDNPRYCYVAESLVFRS